MTDANILVVDDEPDIRDLLKDILEEEGYTVTTACDARQARDMLEEKGDPKLMLLDIWMPGEDGISMLRNWKNTGLLRFPTLMMSGHGTLETAIQATQIGANGFLEKPISLSRLLLAVQENIGPPPGGPNNAPLRDGWFPFIGRSPALQKLKKQLPALLDDAAPLWIVGESGSGRHQLARLIHQWGLRAHGPLVECDQSDTLEQQREKAQQGSLLLRLEQISESATKHLLSLPPKGGPRLLLVSSQKSNAEQPGSTLRVPPLRERSEDIPTLIDAIIDTLHREEGLPFRAYSIAVQNRLRHYPWPGNIRELMTLVTRLLKQGENPIEIAELNRLLESPAQSFPLSLDIPNNATMRQARELFERHFLQHMLQKNRSKMGQLATQLGLERSHLYRKLRTLQISFPKRKADL